MASHNPSSLLKLLKNKYVIASLIFLAIFLFFSNNNLFFVLGLKQDVNALHQKEEELKQEISEDSTLFIRLKDDPEANEQYAREKYNMKRPDEDLFVINTGAQDEQQ